MRNFMALCALALLSTPAAGQRRYPMEPALVEAGPHETASSRVSMVTAAHPFATNAGLEMLRRGGNAMDAAIAATMVTAVIDAGLTSISGGGQLTYYEAKTGRTTALNFEPNSFREDVKPYNPDRDNITGRSIRVPGTVAGLHMAIGKYGSRPWKEILEPAIFYAENGFPIYGRAYTIMRDRYAVITQQPSGTKMFAPKGFLPGVGEIFKQPEMALTLHKIADQGPDYFYKGPFAEEMVKAIRSIGGKPTIEDFTSYKPQELEPVRGTYKDYKLVGPPLPATGIVSIIEGLNILENVDLKRMGHYTQSADSLQWVVETLKVIFADARRYTGVPQFDRELGKLIMSKEYARDRYQIIRHRIEQTKRQASGGDSTGAMAVLMPGAMGPADPELGTNHVSVIDKEGNICSFTHTIYGGIYSYAGLFVGGIVLNSSGGFPSQPGERIVTPMAPLLVFKGDKPYFATGSSGGTLNTFFTSLNVVVWDKNLRDAQDAPRIRVPAASILAAVTEDNTVSIEHRIEESASAELKKRGYKIEWLGPYALPGAQMAAIDPANGTRYGATDPRGGGEAKGQ